MPNIEPVVAERRPPPTQDVGDRRFEDRFGAGIALHRASAIEAGSRHGLCIIKNLSTRGAMVQTQFALSIDEAIVLVMANGTRTAGTVRWIRSDLVGVHFVGTVRLSSLLDREGSTYVGARRRMPRLEIAVPVLVTDARGLKDATTCDISIAGTRLSCREPLARGPITIALPNHPPVGARLLWGIDDQAGCVFDRSFSIDELTHSLRTVE